MLFAVAAQPAIGVVLYGTGLGLIVICTLPPDAAGGGAGAGGVGAGAGEDGAGDDVVGAVGELSVVVHAAPAIVATHAAIGNKNLIRVVDLLPVIVLNLHQAIVTVSKSGIRIWLGSKRQTSSRLGRHFC